MEPVLVVPTTALDVTAPVDLRVTEAAIEATRQKYAALECGTPEGYELVRVALSEVVGMRTGIEARRVELKASALAFGRALDTRARTLTLLVESIEGPLRAKKKAVDDEKARLKAEAEAAKLREIEERLAAERAVEEARLKAIRDAEDARLAVERERLAAERAAMAEEQRKIDAERARLDTIAAEARRAEDARLAEARRIEEAHVLAERTEMLRELAAERAARAKEREELEALRAKAIEEQAEQKRNADAASAEMERVEAFRTAATVHAEALEASGIGPRAAAVFGAAIAGQEADERNVPALRAGARVGRVGQTKVYLHGDNESMFEHGQKLGLTGEALELFAHACYEVEMTLDVDLATGEATIVKVDGRAVAE